MQKRGLIAFFLLIFIFLTGFADNDADNLYLYQWGLRNTGKFFLPSAILANNHKVISCVNDFTNIIFKNSISEIELLKHQDVNQNNYYAKENVDINFEKGYEFFKSIPVKRDTIVAIIDTGIDTNHKELSDSLWVNTDEIPNNGIDDDHNGYIDDVNGYNFYNNTGHVFHDQQVDLHGTHAAGTIAAKHGNGGMKGIAYDEHIKIMSLKILGEDGKGSMTSLIEAIKYAKDNGANIINISLGSYTYDATLDYVIKNSPNILFVVAAGNGANFIGYSLDEKTVYPAKLEYDNIITVSNLCFDGTKYISANYGLCVDIFAPGSFILSTTPHDSFGFLTGTSMAAPFVTATAALMYCAFPNISISKYKNILVNSAHKISELSGLSKSSGYLDIFNALLVCTTMQW